MFKQFFYTELILYLIMALLITACNDNSTDESIKLFEPVKIGALIPLTGTLSEKGKARKNAAQLAVKDLNEAGYPIQLIVADTETNPPAAIAAALHLINEENNHLLIGGSASSVTIAVAEQVSIPRQIPQISYSSTSPLITYLPADEDQDFLFRTVSPDTQQGIILARLAYEIMGYKEVSILYINDAYGKGLSRVFTENFQVLGGKISAAIPHETEPAASYVAALQQAAVGNSEALVAISYTGHARIYLKEAIEYDFFKKFLFTDGTKSEQLIEALGADALEGLCGTASGSSPSDSLDIFNSRYEAEYGESKMTFLTNTYDAVIIAALAAYSAQAAGEALMPITIREHLRKVAGWPGRQVIAGPDALKQALTYLRQGEPINYVGASGDVDFDKQGDVVTPVEIWCYQNGQIVSQSLEQPCLLCGKK